MNSHGKNQPMDDYRSLLLLDELSKNNELTQRDLSKNLGIALGLINSYLKNLVSKGCVTISAIPKKRYKYYVTPKGFREKTRLTYKHLRNFTNLYRVARRDFQRLFQNIIKPSGVKKIAFCGVDEVAEIAYLSLKEASPLELVAVTDVEERKEKFFGHRIVPLEEVMGLNPEVIIITSFRKGEELKNSLVKAGVKEKLICDISGGDWLKKIEESGEGDGIG